MQCPHCDKDALYVDGAYTCPNGHESQLIDEPRVYGPEPAPKPVTREELLAFLDEADCLTREEVHEAIVAAWEIAMHAVHGGEDLQHLCANEERFLAVTK